MGRAAELSHAGTQHPFFYGSRLYPDYAFQVIYSTNICASPNTWAGDGCPGSPGGGRRSAGKLHRCMGSPGACFHLDHDPFVRGESQE